MKTNWCRRKNIRRSNESGSILAMAAISSAALILAGALCIDISHFYLVGTEMQNAADAGALAAASSLNSSATGITKGVDRALNTINMMEFGGSMVTIRREDVRFAVNLSEFDSGGAGRSEAAAAANPQNIRFVKVIVPPKSISIMFAMQTMGGSSMEMSRSAVAGQSAPLNLFGGVIPLSVVEDPETGAPLHVNPECADKTRFTPGCVYTCRLDSCDSMSAGNYLILALNGNRGGNDARERLALSSDSYYNPNITVYTEPGMKAGAVRQGLNVRFDEYTGGLDPSLFPPDANVKTGITYAEYLSGLSNNQSEPSHTGVTDRRVVIIPIVKKNQYDNGRNSIVIDRFGAFFMQTKVDDGNGGSINMEYISDRVVIGDGGYLPDAGPANPLLSVAVLYR